MIREMIILYKIDFQSLDQKNAILPSVVWSDAFSEQLVQIDNNFSFFFGKFNIDLNSTVKITLSLNWWKNSEQCTPETFYIFTW